MARRRPGRRRGGGGADERRPGSAAARAAAARAAGAVQARHPDPGRHRASSRTPPGWRSPTWSRRASTPASRRSGSPTTSCPLLLIVGMVLVATLVQAVARQLFLVRSGRDRPGRALRDPPPGLPALPGAQPGVPRQLHLRAGHLAPDLRRRRDLRDARDRLRRAGHRRADPGRHRRTAALPRPQARAGRAVLRPVPGLADQLVPPELGRELQASPARRSRW